MPSILYPGGSGEVLVWRDGGDGNSGVLHVSVGGKELVDRGDGCYCGGWATGHTDFTPDPLDETPCALQTFEVCLECICCGACENGTCDEPGPCVETYPIVLCQEEIPVDAPSRFVATVIANYTSSFTSGFGTTVTSTQPDIPPENQDQWPLDTKMTFDLIEHQTYSYTGTSSYTNGVQLDCWIYDHTDPDYASPVGYVFNPFNPQKACCDIWLCLTRTRLYDAFGGFNDTFQVEFLAGSDPGIYYATGIGTPMIDPFTTPPPTNSFVTFDYYADCPFSGSGEDFRVMGGGPLWSCVNFNSDEIDGLGNTYRDWFDERALIGSKPALGPYPIRFHNPSFGLVNRCLMTFGNNQGRYIYVTLEAQNG